MSKPTAIIIDIDNVLIQVGYQVSGDMNFCWQDFSTYNKLHSKVIAPGVALVKALLMVLPDMHPIFLTARKEFMRLDTMSQIHDMFGTDLSYHLVMSNTPAPELNTLAEWPEVQREQAAEKKTSVRSILRGYTVLYAVDDQADNVNIFVELGIPTIQPHFVRETYYDA